MMHVRNQSIQMRIWLVCLPDLLWLCYKDVLFQMSEFDAWQILVTKMLSGNLYSTRFTWKKLILSTKIIVPFNQQYFGVLLWIQIFYVMVGNEVVKLNQDCTLGCHHVSAAALTMPVRAAMIHCEPNHCLEMAKPVCLHVHSFPE